MNEPDRAHALIAPRVYQLSQGPTEKEREFKSKSLGLHSPRAFMSYIWGFSVFVSPGFP